MAFECPTCSSRFGTRRGLGVHHSSIHDERLPNRECANCGEEFYCEYEKKYCSRACRRECVSFEGSTNPNYRAKAEQGECRICGTVFEYYSSNKKGLYCPNCIENKSWQAVPDVRGPNNPRWIGGKTEASCTVCSATIERYPSEFTSDVAVCSEECRRAWLSAAFTGSAHPNWQGGGNESYGAGWRRVRKEALERDDYACLYCSETKGELGRNPDVHHVVPVRAFVESEACTEADAHYLENIVSLCIECHRKAEFGKISRGTLQSLTD